MAGKGENRGPKLKRIGNSAPSQSRLDRSPMEPTFKLNLSARREFRRLALAISARGLLGRVDPGHVTLCAKLTAELERILADPVGPETVKLVSVLTSQIRGLKRECSLTSQPSRSAVKVPPGSSAGGAFGEWQARNGGA